MKLDSNEFSFKSVVTSPTCIIVAINVLVFLITDLPFDFTDDIIAWGWSGYHEILEQGQWYRLITAMFLHADIGHIGGNMLLVFFLGIMLEDYFGKVPFTILYFLTGILADLSSIVYNSKVYSDVVSIGASGAGFGLLGAVLCVIVMNGGRFKDYDIRQVILGVALALYSGFRSSSVDNIAHAGGLAAGLVIAAILQLIMNIRGKDYEN